MVGKGEGESHRIEEQKGDNEVTHSNDVNFSDYQHSSLHFYLEKEAIEETEISPMVIHDKLLRNCHIEFLNKM